MPGHDSASRDADRGGDTAEEAEAGLDQVKF